MPTVSPAVVAQGRSVATFSEAVAVGTFLSVVAGDTWSGEAVGSATDDAGNRYFLDTLNGAYLSWTGVSPPPGYPGRPRTTDREDWYDNSSPSLPVVFHAVTTVAINPGDQLHVNIAFTSAFTIIVTAFPELEVAGLDLSNPTWGRNTDSSWEVGGYSSANSLTLFYGTFGDAAAPVYGDWTGWYDDTATGGLTVAAWQLAADDSLKTIGGTDGNLHAGVIVSYKLGSPDPPHPPAIGPTVVLSGAAQWSEPPSYEFHFSTDVPVGSTVLVAVCDGFGWGSTPALLYDTAGNAYSFDTSGEEGYDYETGFAWGGGTLALGHCTVNHAITAGDTLTMMVDRDYGGNVEYGFAIYALAVPAELAVAAIGAQRGDLTATLDCPARTLAVGFSVATAADMEPDDANGWTQALDSGALNQNWGGPTFVNRVEIAYRDLDAEATLTFSPGSANVRYSATGIMAYRVVSALPTGPVLPSAGNSRPMPQPQVGAIRSRQVTGARP